MDEMDNEMKEFFKPFQKMQYIAIVWMFGIFIIALFALWIVGKFLKVI